ncbi:damage-inducible protein DinB [Parapedobacter sp. ISTM3]|uniref:DinB family protein n=1 Tax=Parapedobacter sp. ISTM3 TaxID=2800130 RepID=UPI001908A3DC|nr:DinB family protein [Parapedobacter sp. ISTM3]MBK1439748.1 damage-inducible protein DinB [Parapedobacter sp. ISTM3]
MKALFNELFAYNFHCNQQLAAVLMDHAAAVDAKSMDLFSHMLNAHHIWNHRILNQPTRHSVWEKHPSNILAVLDRRNYDQTLTILETSIVGDEVNYKTSKGIPFTNTVGDVLFHIINHSTYHRGQIALLFRQNGMEPLQTDYIFRKR